MMPTYSSGKLNRLHQEGKSQMLEIHKNYIFDKDNQPIAVQIPFSEFEQIEEILEDFGLVQLMLNPEDNERLSKEEALKYYQSLQKKDVES
jgi:hypothetical protein